MASNRELVERYQNAIAILLPFVKGISLISWLILILVSILILNIFDPKDLPKDEFSKTLRSQARFFNNILIKYNENLTNY